MIEWLLANLTDQEDVAKESKDLSCASHDRDRLPLIAPALLEGLACQSLDAWRQPRLESAARPEGLDSSAQEKRGKSKIEAPRDESGLTVQQRLAMDALARRRGRAETQG